MGNAEPNLTEQLALKRPTKLGFVRVWLRSGFLNLTIEQADKLQEVLETLDPWNERKWK